MKKALLSLGVLGISLGVPLKIFADKVDEKTQNAYWQGQVHLAKINIDRLRMLQAVRCSGMDLGTYFLMKANEKGFPTEVSAVIPQESSGDVYATGCDPCPKSWELTMKRKTDTINSQWLNMVFGQGLHNYCLRKNPTRENTCTVGFGLMQITSHTLSEGDYPTIVQPYALISTKAHVVKGRGNYEAVNEEPKNSPYNPCTNIAVGLSILRDKYEICRRKYGDKSAKTMACAVCYYNGKTDYLTHLRRTVIDRGQAGLLVRAGFIKDGSLEGLRKFLVDIEGFVKRWNEEEKRGKICVKVF